MTDNNESATATIREAILRLRDLPGNLEAEDDPAFTIEQINHVRKRLYDVRALLEGNQPDEEDEDFGLRVHERLAKLHQIAAIWSVEDVQEMRPDLSEAQAWKVLQLVREQHDAAFGITWETLECAAESLFGDAPDSDDE